MSECPYYKAGNCQEGVFSLMLSANGVLHLSGCKNKAIHFDLNELYEKQIEEAFNILLNLLEE